ncbi:MAG TPA: glycoside hydrolase family 9 protein [Prolixibacteraceae bacterium]|nr:glycoside hydrolase family 9 protein [Prolixibacteraceae bacterium]
MKHITKCLLLIVLFSCSLLSFSQTGAIRINQLGYYPTANKIAIVAFPKANTFEVVNVHDNSIELTGNLSAKVFWKDAGDSIKRCDFSSITKPGTYQIRIPGFGESYPFEISSTVLRKAAYASLKSFYYQRSSYELTAPYAGLWARPAGHPDTQCILHSSTGKTGTLSSPGGWYDAGDYGKYVINAGISVASMLSFYENFNTFFADGTIHIPESGNGKNDLLDEVKFELDWLKTMQDEDGGVFFKLTTLSFSGFVMPAADKADRYVIGKTTTSALDFAAMMAMAGRIYQEYDADYAADCIARAKNAWTWAKAHPAIYFKNPSDVSTGEYGDGNASDEFIWAAAELYITTQESEYKTYLESKSSSLTYKSAPGWPGVQPLASLSLVTRPNGLSASLLTTIKNSLVSTADSWLSQIAANACRIPSFGYYWGSNSGLANQGVGLLYAYIVTEDPKYIKGAAECADYLLGKNATGFSFVTGYGSKTPMYIHHRPSHADGVAQPIPGFVSGGPNAGKEDNEKYPFIEPAKSFVDVMGSYASNEVCINWNSPMTALFAGVDAILGDNSSVDFEVQTSMNNPPTISITSPLHDSRTGSDQAIKVRNTATDLDGITKVEYYIDARFAGVDSISPFECTLNALSAGLHTVSVLAIDSKGLASEKTNKFSIYQVNTVPGKVEAEDYSGMAGITIQNTSDAGGGLNITSVDAMDWMDYSLNIERSGYYRVEFRVAGSAAGGKFELRKPTGLSFTTLDVPHSGSQKWVTISDTIQLAGGKQTFRLYSLAGGWNINWLNFVRLIPTSIENTVSSVNVNSLTVAPNPVISNFTVKYDIAEFAPLKFTLYDEKGNEIGIREIEDISSHSGKFNWTIGNNLAAGSYYIIMQQQGKKVASYKLIKAQ